MTNIERITGVKYSASDTQTDVRWAAARSKRLSMLRGSDWTQLRDVYHLLTPQQRLAWEVWRRQVRSTKASLFSSPDDYEAALTSLSFKLPSEATLQPDGLPSVDQQLYQHSAATLEEGMSISPTEAVYEIVHLATQTMTRKCGIVNVATVTERLAQASELLVATQTGGDTEPSSYPLIAAVAHFTDTPLYDVAESTMKRYQNWIAGMSSLEGMAEFALWQLTPTVSEQDAKTVITWLDEQIVGLLDSIDRVV